MKFNCVSQKWLKVPLNLTKFNQNDRKYATLIKFNQNYLKYSILAKFSQNYLKCPSLTQIIESTQV
jgi:hypothetical protein